MVLNQTAPCLNRGSLSQNFCGWKVQTDLYQRIYDVHGKTGLSQKNIYEWATLFKDWNSIQDVINLANKRITIENIQLEISVGPTHKIVHDDLCLF